MPDDDFDDVDLDEDSGVIKTLRKQLRDAEKDAAEAPELRKKLALHDAGLGNLSEIQRKALLSTHEGDLTAEALTAHAVTLGFVEAPKQEPQISAEEQAQLQRVADVAGGEPSDAREVSLKDRIDNAKSQEELDSILSGAGMLQPEE